jgi:PAS domain S-box-containing protein
VEYTGIPEAEQLGSGWLEQLHPDDRDRTIAAWNAAVGSESFLDVEFRIRRKDGIYRWFKTRAVAIHDGQGRVVKWFGTNTDIDDQKRAEERLREAEERFRIAAETSTDVIYEWDLQQGIHWFGNIDEMLGYGPGEFPRTLDAWADSVHPQDLERVMAGVQTHLETRSPYVSEYRVRRKDGIYRWWAARGIAARAPNGDPVRWIGTVTDITDRKQAEEAARKAQAELLDERQHEKEHAEAELAQMRDRLVRATRLAAIGQVSASIAHDLRNPLGTVRNAAYYLGRRLPKDQPEVAEYLGIINQEVAAADRIITNLLAVAGAKEPVKQHVDVGQAIREALARTGQAKAVRLRMSLAPEPFMVRADPDHLRQVFRNLVTNAAEAMGDGGEIIVEAARDADGDSIVLRDTGPGVSQEIRETVFEPLVTTKAKGIGLGLTICREILEHHGGGIELIDEGKPGAAFRIRLPRQ